MFAIGLLYFYIAFEEALRDDYMKGFFEDKANVGSAFWMALASMLVMLPAVVLSFIRTWRAMKMDHPSSQGEE
jgi:hypothetical protein